MAIKIVFPIPFFLIEGKMKEGGNFLIPDKFRRIEG